MIVEPNFVDEHDLIELIKLIRKFAGPLGPHSWPEGQCASLVTDLTQVNSDLVKMLERRLVDHLCLATYRAEQLRGVWYRTGEGYRIHHDAFSRGTKEWEESLAVSGNRAWTVMIYLNTLMTGGETIFPNLGLRVAPRAGMLIAWRNLTPVGEPDARMMHFADGPVNNDKYIVTQWYREYGASTL